MSSSCCPHPDNFYLFLASSSPGAIGLSLGVLGGSIYLALASSMTSARFWLCGFVTIFTALLRDFSWRAYVRLHDPSEVTKRQASAYIKLIIIMILMMKTDDDADYFRV